MIMMLLLPHPLQLYLPHLTHLFLPHHPFLSPLPFVHLATKLNVPSAYMSLERQRVMCTQHLVKESRCQCDDE